MPFELKKLIKHQKDKANSILDKHFGTNLSEEYADNAGYVRHAFNKEQFNICHIRNEHLCTNS